MPSAPRRSTSPRLSRMPNRMMPSRKIRLRLKRIPGSVQPGSLTRLPITSPIRIAIMMPEIGVLSKPSRSTPIHSLDSRPSQATAAVSSRPGTIRAPAAKLSPGEKAGRSGS